VTNELAVLAPYEITFRCFSPELAAVLGGFASSPYGLLVKTINVEAAPATAASPEQAAVPIYQPSVPAYTPPPPPRGGEPPNMAERYALSLRAVPRPPPQQAYAPAPVPAPSTASRGGLPLALDEKQLKVTLMLNVVKLVSPK
jgi:hypothetical protein